MKTILSVALVLSAASIATPALASADPVAEKICHKDFLAMRREIRRSFSITTPDGKHRIKLLVGSFHEGGTKCGANDHLGRIVIWEMDNWGDTFTVEKE